MFEMRREDALRRVRECTTTSADSRAQLLFVNSRFTAFGTSILAHPVKLQSMTSEKIVRLEDARTRHSNEPELGVLARRRELDQPKPRED